MTNDLNPETQDQETNSSQDNEGLQDPVTEAPSEYEFADDNSMETQPLEETVNRSPVLPVVAALVGIIFFGSVVWWQLGKDASAPDSPIQGVEAVGLPKISAEVDPSAGRITGMESAPKSDSLAASGSLMQDGALGQSTSVRPPDEPVEASVKPADAYAVQQMAAPEPQPVATAPVQPATPVVAASVQDTLPKGAEIGSVTLIDAKGPDPRVDALVARVESLQRGLDQLSQQIGQMASASAQAPAGDTKPFQDRIDQLERQLNAASSAPVSQGMVSSGDGGPSDMFAAPVTRAPAAKPAPTRKVVKKPAPKANTTKTTSSSLVLRAATPKQAWIAPSKTSHDLREVRVGDKVTGIGTIVAIEQQGDKWVVRGTNGSIR